LGGEKSRPRTARSATAPANGLLQFIGKETLTGKYSLYKKRAPPAADDYVKEPVDVSGLMAMPKPQDVRLVGDVVVVVGGVVVVAAAAVVAAAVVLVVVFVCLCVCLCV
jgi:hypothetical protein